MAGSAGEPNTSADVRFADFRFNRAWRRLEAADASGNTAASKKAKDELSDAFRLQRAVAKGQSVSDYYVNKYKAPEYSARLKRALTVTAAVALLFALAAGVYFAVRALPEGGAAEPSRSDAGASGSDLGHFVSELDKRWLAGIKLNDYSVYIRSGPGTQFEQLEQAFSEYGTLFGYLGEQKAEDGVLWYHISHGDNSDGWVSSEFTKKIYIIPDDAGSGNQTIDAIAQKYDAIGVQLAIIENGVISGSYSYGWAELGESVMTENTLFRTASLSKLPLCLCAFMLEEKGLLDSDEDIGEYWGFPVRNPGWPGEIITLRDLLTETSSLTYHDYASYTLEDTKKALKASAAYERKYRPGTAPAWSYCNFATGVAGSTIELATSESLVDYSARELFVPLGISASFVSGELEGLPYAALYSSAHNLSRGEGALSEKKANPSVGENIGAWAGGLTASAADMAAILALYANSGEYGGERYVSAEIIQKTEERLYAVKEYGVSFEQATPLRFEENVLGQSGLYYLYGNAYGALTMASYNPETGKGVVVLTSGASSIKDSNGFYSVCAELSSAAYAGL